MKILYLAHRIPYPPNKGDKIRSYHQLRHLCGRHDVWCACFVDRREDMRHIEMLRQWCCDVKAIPAFRVAGMFRAFAGFASGGTATEALYRSFKMERVLREWSAGVSFDAALFFSSGVAQYHRTIAARRKVLDFCDWDSLKWSSYAGRASGLRSRLLSTEADRLRRRESEWVAAFDACTVVTEAEKRACPSGWSDRVHVVGNGIDAGMEPGMAAGEAPPRVGFVGQMDYGPNVEAVCWFAQRVLPQVRRRIPEVEFQIVGRAPTRRVRRLHRRKCIEVTGEVKDARQYIERFAVSAAPLRMGQGLQNKVLEAMAAARPVVASPIAAAGIDAVDGVHFLVADRPEDMAGKIIGLLEDPGRRRALGEAARRRVIERCGWAPALDRLEGLLRGDGAPIRLAQVPRPSHPPRPLVGV